MSKVELILKEAEIIRVNPQPGEILFFKFKGEEFMNENLDSFGQQLRTFFPDNKVIVVALPDGCDIELTSVKNQAKVEVSDCSVPTSYCSSCSCGKKERIEGISGTGGGIKG